jgi:thioesterase domain-containing protein
VSTLFLLDSWVPRYFERLNPVRRWIAERSLRWQWLLDDWRLKKDRSDGWAWFWSRRPTLARLLALAAVPVKPPDQDEYALAAHDEWLLQYLQELTRKYEPKPYHGKIVLIRSYQEPTGWWFEKNAGWASFAAGGLQLHMVQGNHFTMFREPGVLKLAACVRTALDEGKSVPIKAARPAVARQPITTSLTPQRPGAGSAT